MRLTTVGTGTAAPSATRVCAGHLLEAGDMRILMDCGSGVVHRFAQLGLDWMGITHLALTHFDADHTSDVPTLITAWRWGALPARSAPVEVLGPPGTDALFDRLAAAFGPIVREPGYPLRIREIEPGTPLDLGSGVMLETRKVPHTEESIAYSVVQNDRRVVYTGDTGFDAGLGAWAAGADALLTECSLPAELAIPTHLTPEQCGELAAIATPRQLVLTHFYPPVERTDIRAAVAEHFRGPVVLASDGWSTEIGST
ncbi:MAG TPA: ribonuclease Z [Gemmatimonadaceae bacterium]|jgi:ribonuclease BN (tRNA processing enzyme)|nr:ribonuclease Z [Gemmatimonadaceae bacterium]